MDSRQERAVILTSGGLDSFLAHYEALEKGYEPFHIYVDLGHPYNWKEKSAIRSFPFRVVEIKAKVCREDLNTMPSIDDWIIPGRNLLLVTIGAMFGKRIWLCALNSEMHKYARERDKSPEFYHLASGLLTYIFDILRPETIVETPFRNVEKVEVLEKWLKRGVKKENILKTNSCYSEEKGHCGKCGACFKRWIAFTNVGIEQKFNAIPWKNDYAVKSLERMKKAIKDRDYTHYTKKRIYYTMKAMITVDNSYKEWFRRIRDEIEESET